MKRVVVSLIIAALSVTVSGGCSGQSEADKAKAWVTSNGGVVGADETGWAAVEADWAGTWPWPSASVSVGCAPDLYGGTTYVQIRGDRYWLLETHGYPPDGGFYKASAASITTDVDAQIEWSGRSGEICGISA